MRKRDSLVSAAAVGGAMLLASCERAAAPQQPPSEAPAVAAAVAALPEIEVSDEIRDFYKERGFRPLWVRRTGLTPEGKALIAMMADAREHGLDPERYDLTLLRRAAAAVAGDPDSAAKAELILSRAFAAYVRDLHSPVDSQAMFLVDKELAPPRLGERAVLDAAAGASSLAAHVDDVGRLNPLYEALRTGLSQHRAAGGDAAGERLILANMERARRIPANPARRYIIVDAAGARLWMIEDGKVVDQMRTVVGKPDMATPEMAGLIRYAVLNPYWNLPPDLARERAKRVLKRGPGAISGERLQILSDWSERPRVLMASQVNWRAVAAGKQTLRMRQLPGGSNVMGNVKFMLPNRLGIYLHDTPNKQSFALADRRLSSGCVRVEDAARLSRWLFGGREVRPSGAEPEQRVDLPDPVPVYITYLTAIPAKGGGIAFRRDHYGRDRTLLARLDERSARSPKRA